MNTRPLRCWDGHLRLALMEHANELLDMLPKRKVFMAERNQCTVCVMPVHQTERSVVSEAAQAALTEPGLDALPKATMRWPDSLQVVLLALRAACEANEQSLQRILCTPPVRSGQKDKQTAELKKLLWEYDALRLLCNTNSEKPEQFTAVRLLLCLLHEPGDDPTAEQGANMPELLSLMKTMRARSERLAKKTYVALFALQFLRPNTHMHACILSLLYSSFSMRTRLLLSAIFVEVLDVLITHCLGCRGTRGDKLSPAPPARPSLRQPSPVLQRSRVPIN